MKMCSVPDCGGNHHAKGFCEPHYNSFWLYGHPTHRVRKINERFIHSDSLAPLDLTESQEASLLSLVRFLPGKQP